MSPSQAAGNQFNSPPFWEELPKNQSFFNGKNLIRKACQITPRIAVTALAGYYILGYAYVYGWMAMIDQFAIRFMRDQHMGYMAIGALMPTIQWYAAWGVRITAGTLAYLSCCLIQKIIAYTYSFFSSFRKTKRVSLPI